MGKFVTMKKLLLILMVSTTAVYAQSTDEKEVAAQVERLRLAMITPDKAILGSLTSDDLSYGHSSGVIEDKAAFVSSLVEKKSVFTSITLEDQSIRVSGNTAIVRHKLVGDTFNNNTPGKVDILVIMVWQKQNGQWKLLARQAAKIPAPVKN
jgi:hypothetical protein